MADGVISANHNRALQRKRARSDSLTRAQRILFLDHLAVTANVRHSARTAGRSDRLFYASRERDPEFAAAWQVALEAGYVRIEEELLAHALGDVTTDYVPGESGVEPAAPFDPLLALKILRRRDTARVQPLRPQSYNRAPLDEVRKVLIHKLDMLAKRLGNAR